MKKRKIILFFILTLSFFFFISSVAQNLVPNNSFESIDTCYYHHLGSSAVSTAPPWDSPTSGSPDLYNTCASNIPDSFTGYQYPHSGNGYVGEDFSSDSGPNIREYIQVELDTSLVAGQEYCVSFYVSLADKMRYACNNLGIYFSTTHTHINASYAPLNFTPQINDTNIVSDTTNWTLIYGQYTAQGGERYIIIGNFFSDALTDTIHSNPGGQLTDAYYYIDDVNVHCCRCDSTTHLGVEELGIKNEELEVYPNPNNGAFTINLNKEYKNIEIEITDVIGQVVYNAALKETTQTTVQLSVKSGIYFIEVKTEAGIMRKKLVKE